MLNPAETHQTKGMVFSLRGDCNEEAAIEFQKAIQLGLPDDDEMFTRYALGETLFDIALEKRKSFSELPTSPIFREAIAQMERALEMDKQGKYEYFLEPINRARLNRLDRVYNFLVDTIPDRANFADRIAYLQQKVALVAFLPSCPFLLVLFKLAAMYTLERNFVGARICLKNILDAEAVDRTDEKGEERKLREEARDALGSLS